MLNLENMPFLPTSLSFFLNGTNPIPPMQLGAELEGI